MTKLIFSAGLFIFFYINFIFCFSSHLHATKKNVNGLTRYPFIFVPGDGGNRLYAKLNKNSSPNFLCSKKTDDYYLLWFSIKQILPYFIDCFVDNIKLNYDNQTRKNSNTPGVDIKIEGFGQTDSIEYLDSFQISPTIYFAQIIDSLVSKYKYTRGVNLRGALYTNIPSLILIE